MSYSDDGDDLFHTGERTVQARAGVRSEVDRWAPKALRDHLTEGQQEFFATKHFVVLAARDDTGRPWATLLAGPRGFMHAPHPQRLFVGAQPGEGDPLRACCVTGRDVGLLGIDFESRRRNRVNGRVASASVDTFTLEVSQAFGNCPRHIQPRRDEVSDAAPNVTAHGSSALSADQMRLLADADTLFIASGYGGREGARAHGMDASHRGGPRGFVQVESAARFGFPDYPGNNLFNTLGNLERDPRVGLCFVGFDEGDLLQVAGRAHVQWSEERAEAAAAERWVWVDVEHAVYRPGALALRWKDLETPTACP